MISHVVSMHVPLWRGASKSIKPAPVLTDPKGSAELFKQFHKQLIAYPLQCHGTARIPGHPAISLHWTALFETAGLLWLRSDGPDWDAVSLLLNGVETPDEVELIERHVPMFRSVWDEIAGMKKPLAVNGYKRANRMQDSAVVTVLGAFANAYFVQFGTNFEDDA